MDNFSSLEYGPLHPVKGMTDVGKLGWNPLLIVFTGLKTILSPSSCKLLNIFFSPSLGEKVYKIKRISFYNFDQQDNVCFSRLTLCYLPPVTKFYRNQTKRYFRSLTPPPPITVIKEYHHHNKKKPYEVKTTTHTAS